MSELNFSVKKTAGKKSKDNPNPAGGVAFDREGAQPEGWSVLSTAAISPDGASVAILPLEGEPVVFDWSDWAKPKVAFFLAYGLSQKARDGSSAEKDPAKKAEGVRAALEGFADATFADLISRSRGPVGPSKVGPETLAIQTWLNTEGTKKGDPADRKVKMRANFLRAGIDPTTIKTLGAFTQAFEKVLTEVFKLSGPGLETAKTKIPTEELKVVIEKALEKAKGQAEVEETAEPVF